MLFPFLSVIVFTPAAAALIILMLPGQKKDLVRSVALAAATLDLLLSLWVYLTYLTQGLSGYQFVELYNWLPALGISLHFGVDGISAPLVLLTGVVMFTGAYILKGIKQVLHGPMNEKWSHGEHKVKEISLRETVVMAPLLVLILAIGVWPAWILEVINKAVIRLF